MTEDEYIFPPLSLLKRGLPQSTEADSRHSAEQLLAVLQAFEYAVSIDEVLVGPSSTRCDIRFETGTRLTSIQRLKGDICMSLGVNKINISAAPKKPFVIAFEIPNDSVNDVYIRDVVCSQAFLGSDSELTIAIGKDNTGEPVVADLNKLSHLLIVGATGSGKSTLLHTIIISLLYKANPDNLKFILIDTKGLEFGRYNCIPHLYLPVITDPKKATGALQWMITEIHKRYSLFSEVNARNFESYNEYLLENGQPEMPNIVLIIDELADIISVASKEVEESICRITQIGRTFGIHLILSTQYPSSKFIKKLTKLSAISKVCFSVISVKDSATILGQEGAELLSHCGEMLFSPNAHGDLHHIQCAFVSDKESNRVADFIKKQSVNQYSEEVMAQIDKAAAGESFDDYSGDDSSDSSYSYDELLPQAVDVVFDTEQASVSMIQRRLQLGYSRAAGIIDQMEELGIVGPFDGSRPRQIIITKEQWAGMKHEYVNSLVSVDSVQSCLLKTVDALYQEASVLVFVYSDKMEAEGASVEKVTINYERITKIGVIQPRKFYLKKPTPELHIRYYDEENEELDVYLKTRSAQEIVDLIIPYLQ